MASAEVMQTESEARGRAVAEVHRHAWEAHGMALSAEQALLLAFRAELDEEAWPCRLAGEVSSEPPADGISDR
jgi:hypothetical protein